MTTIGAVIRNMMPSGTNPGGDDPDWSTCPEWPPDLFGVTATLIERTGLYSHAWLYAHQSTHASMASSEKSSIRAAGRGWRDKGVPDSYTKRLWHEVTGSADHVDLQALAHTAPSHPLARKLITLMCIADEAAEGMGFVPKTHAPANGPSPDRISPFTRAVLGATIAAEPAYTTRDATAASPVMPKLPHFPQSLTLAVTPLEAVVFPKSRLPDVGCTLRSMSHNLALLPPRSMVEANWLISGLATDPEHHRPLGILLIPWPARVNGSLFKAERRDAEEPGYFTVDVAGYDDALSGPTNVSKLAVMFAGLIQAGEKELGEIHAVFLPECALPTEIAEDLAKEVARRHPRLQLFISGAIGKPANSEAMPRNLAFTASTADGAVQRSWTQSKHHRWKLNGDQIRRYHMGHVLDPTREWWEYIDVSGRTCHFSVIDNDLSLAVLICEDLARFDPVLPVINAIGPSLVVALLMDGPQLEKRWPGRYATVLAEDPGSSVLTFTSTALIDRQHQAGTPKIRTIALWKQPGGLAQELAIGPDDQALALCLVREHRQQISIDGRSKNSFFLSLAGVRAVKPPDPAVLPRRKSLNKPT
jgi:hypothetical protein